MSEYAAVTEWHPYEGAVHGYNELGDEVVEIEALQNQRERLRWGETYTPGRAWYVTHEDGRLTHGHAPDLRAAKKQAAQALASGGRRA